MLILAYIFSCKIIFCGSLDHGILSMSRYNNVFSFSDTDGRALLGRFQTKTQDLEADDQEVKVQVVKIPFKFLGTHCVYCAPLTRCTAVLFPNLFGLYC